MSDMIKKDQCFNAENHRFGMAYRHREMGLVYPFYLSDNGRLTGCVVGDQVCNIDRKTLLRTPENDLLPRYIANADPCGDGETVDAHTGPV